MNINLTLLMQAVAFAVFIWFCARFIWPYLMRAIEERQKQIADGLAAGEEGRQSLTRAEKRIAEMLNEAKTRASDIVAQGEKLKSDTVDQARTDAQAARTSTLRKCRQTAGLGFNASQCFDHVASGHPQSSLRTGG